MNVLQISHHCCIRVVKTALALMKSGVGVQFLQHHINNPDVAFALMFSTFYQTQQQFDLRCKTWPEEVDLFHIHNGPDWIVWRAKEMRPEMPVIYDVHDMDSLRWGKMTEDEEKAFAAADGYVFVSHACADYARERHGPAMEGKPVAVIWSCCLEDSFQNERLTRVGGVVYEGGVRAMIPDAPDQYASWMDYGQVAVECRKRDIPFTIYTPHTQYWSAYHQLGAICAGPLRYDELLRQLTRYHWGFVGCPGSHPQWEKTVPNKLFEYVAAGIPVLAINAGASAEIIRDYKLGVVLQDWHELDSVYHLHDYFREKVWENRATLTMEHQVPTIKALYKEVLDGRT